MGRHKDGRTRGIEKQADEQTNRQMDRRAVGRPEMEIGTDSWTASDVERRLWASHVDAVPACLPAKSCDSL